MNKDALQRLREPAAFALLGAAGLQLLAGLIYLFSGDRFTFTALQETLNLGYFAGLPIAILAAGAVFFAAYGEQQSKQARNVVFGALGVLGVAALFSVICVLSGLVADGAGGGIKAAAFFFGIAKLLLVAIAGYYVFTVFQALQPARPAGMPGGLGVGQPYGQQQYGPPGDPYAQGQPGYGQQQPQQYGQPVDPYAQQQYGQSPQQYGHPGDPYAQGQPGYGQQQQQPPQQYGQPAAPQLEPGQWTRQYGDEAPQGQQSPQQNDQNWYRGDQGPQ